MVQQRIYDFGALLTQGRTKTFATSLFTPGIYEGFVPTIISSTLIEFSAGTLLLPNGVLVRETATTQVIIPTPASAENYTITVDHDDIQAVGGSPATYTLRSGILAREQEPLPNSLALLWVRHTGAGPLTDSMLSRPPTLQAGSLLNAIEDGFLAAPFPTMCDVTAGPNVTAAQQSFAVNSGAAAAILGAAGGGVITVTGLTNMSANSVGRYLLTSGGVNPLNNGAFEIVAYNSVTSVDISDNGVAPGGESILWTERELHNLGLQIVNSAVSGLQTYRFRLPLPPRPLPRSIQVFADLPPLAGISISTSPYLTFDADGMELGSTPASIAGPVSALDPRLAPIGTFTLDNFEETSPPVSLGVTITVPPQTAGVFLKGFNLVGD